MVLAGDRAGSGYDTVGQDSRTPTDPIDNIQYTVTDTDTETETETETIPIVSVECPVMRPGCWGRWPVDRADPNWHRTPSVSDIV